MFYKRAAIVLFFVILFIFFSKSAFAVAPTITAYPNTTINLDTSFTITATMSGLSKNVIYRLRVAISQPGTTIYFGSTYDGVTWHMGSIADGNFVSIATDGNGAWGGDIQGKIDSDDPNFTAGSGTYDLKIGRYTQTGSTATWSEPVSITIVVPATPTPTPTSTATPTPTNTPAPTSSPTSTPTKTPTPTPTKSPSPTLKPTSTSSSLRSIGPTYEIGPTSVLGESTESENRDDQKSSKITPVEETKVLGAQTNNLSKILITIGVILLITCGILFFRSYINNKKQQEV